MKQVADRLDVAGVAACTARAVHGRDHEHRVNVQCCHPHAVEVIYLGHRALIVCHDCQVDSGFLPYREAVHLAEVHREQTREASAFGLSRVVCHGLFGPDGRVSRTLGFAGSSCEQGSDDEQGWNGEGRREDTGIAC